ncbi:small membrane A-kinase anchor protein-like [Coregonus clupeaformis]|uniref:small membrane A-kinase anchor protein-like n=1 Tax=Coregonus clupeaformis TaxID=59861 RepID=UPI001BDF9CC0|nr:small membrane A-kinase anchor protein-like [Coregonus clupeaformis]XP_041700005.1 small membrane A-kinase anchor protein-like [Coregonus clupeaformis]XP_041700006.1 small membrane A-kinase anchor protein-like [Coregonus clupeaformis]
MGCVKSKKSDLIQYANSVEKADGKPGKRQGVNTLLVHYERGSADDSARVDPILLEYAQRLSEEIVARAVQQWSEVDSRYSDIPYIECDVP